MRPRRPSRYHRQRGQPPRHEDESVFRSEDSRVRSDSRLRRVPVNHDTTWIREAMLPFDAYAVGTIVPVAFESYGRILHPAWTRSGSPVRRDSVAAWSGGTVHALAQFDPLARPRGDTIGAPPFDRRPDGGELPRHVLIALCDTLAAHTTTPEACFVGLWGGRVLLEPGIRTLRLPLPERAHLVFEGSLAAVDDAGWTEYELGAWNEGDSVEIRRQQQGR